jgi:uncharacterized protein YbcV (DUF1398 family)
MILTELRQEGQEQNEYYKIMYEKSLKILEIRENENKILKKDNKKLIKKNKKINKKYIETYKEMRKVNTELLEEMEKNTILEFQLK